VLIVKRSRCTIATQSIMPRTHMQQPIDPIQSRIGMLKPEHSGILIQIVQSLAKPTSDEYLAAVGATFSRAFSSDASTPSNVRKQTDIHPTETLLKVFLLATCFNKPECYQKGQGMPALPIINNIDISTHKEAYLVEVRRLLLLASTTPVGNDVYEMVFHLFISTARSALIAASSIIALSVAMLAVLAAFSMLPVATSLLLLTSMTCIAIGVAGLIFPINYGLTLVISSLQIDQKQFDYTLGESTRTFSRPECLYRATRGWFFKGYESHNMKIVQIILEKTGKPDSPATP
jgi:hypothetical protein